MSWRGLLLIGTSVVWLSAAPAAAQAPPPTTSGPQTQTIVPDPKSTPPQTSPTTTPPPLPVNLAKIREALDRPQTIKLNDQSLWFVVEIHPPPISFMALVGSYDLLKGPVAGAPIPREITNMQTPREMYSSAGITATDQLQFAATSYAAQALVKKAVQEIKQAHDQAQVDAIRARIDHELAALMAADKGGGGPD